MTVSIYVGDCIEVLRTLPAESVHCVVTSPPFYGLRDYGVEGQMGLEDSPDAYVAKLVDVFREVRRVLHPTGVVWLNLGDSYASTSTVQTTPKARGGRFGDGNGTGRKEAGEDEITVLDKPGLPRGMKPKDLMMIPARVALALQEDGWWLRSQVIWHKPNAMPESVTDRPTTDYECVYLLAKEAQYFYDADAIREPYNEGSLSRYGYEFKADVPSATVTKNPSIGAGKIEPNPSGRNKRTVWTIPTRPFSAAHFATFPVDLVEPMIKAGTSERGACPECGCQWERVVERIADKVGTSTERPKAAGAVKAGQAGHGTSTSTLSIGGRGNGGAWRDHGTKVVPLGWQPTCDCDAGEPIPAVCLDPFAGAGTALMVADRLGRDAIGIELNPEYAEMSARRIYDDAGMFAEVEVHHALD